MRITGAALAAAGLLLAAGDAWAERAGGVDAAEPESVLEAVRAFGHKARLEVDEAGYPVVLARMGEISYGVQFYGCEGTTNCSQLQFAATFDMEPGLSTDFVNQRNEERALGRLSVDANGDPLFTYFLTTEGGLSAENFRAVMQLWTDALASILEAIGY
jgi:hypothetical protein